MNQGIFSLTSYFKKEDLITFIENTMPSYIKLFLNENEIEYFVVDKNDCNQLDSELLLDLNDSYGICYYEPSIEGDYYDYKIYLNFENITELDLEMLHEDIPYDNLILENVKIFKENPENQLLLDSLKHYILIKNLMLTFYHELAHVMDDFLYSILSEKEKSSNECGFSYSSLSEEFKEISDLSSIYIEDLSCEGNNYEDDELINELFADSFAMFLILKIINESQLKNIFIENYFEDLLSDELIVLYEKLFNEIFEVIIN